MVDVGAKEVDAVKPLLRDLPDIIVGTPGRLAQHLKYEHVFYQCSGAGFNSVIGSGFGIWIRVQEG